MDNMELVIIVEGKRDKEKLERLVSEDVLILCTLGTPGTEQLDVLRRQVNALPVFIYTDNDRSGRHIRYLLREQFPDAEHIYTKRGYAGVEGTPDEDIIKQLEKVDLHDVIVYPPPQSTLY